MANRKYTYRKEREASDSDELVLYTDGTLWVELAGKDDVWEMDIRAKDTRKLYEAMHEIFSSNNE